MGKATKFLWGTVAEKRRLMPDTFVTRLAPASIRESELRGICSAAMKELWNILKDQSEERTVTVFVSNKGSAIWKDASMKTLVRDDQLNTSTL